MSTTARAYRSDRYIRNWRVRLDAHIARCPGCDQWCWDGRCPDCNPAPDPADAFLARKANA